MSKYEYIVDFLEKNKDSDAIISNIYTFIKNAENAGNENVELPEDNKNNLIFKCILPFATYLHVNYSDKQLERISSSLDKSLR